MQTASLTLITTLALLGPLPTSVSSGQPGGAEVVIPNCQVSLLDDVDVPAQEAGPLVAVHVSEGDFVQEGQLVAQIDDRQAQLEREAAQLQRDAAQAQADDDIEVLYAEKSCELAEAELEQDLEINRKSPGAVPASEIRRKQLARHRAELQIDRSRLELKVAQMSADVQNAAVHAADESILRRRILAPFAGVVVDLYRESSEWVNAGEAVLRVVRLDRLGVDGFLDGHQFDPAAVMGRAVRVEIELARGRREAFAGRITYVSPLVQAGNQYRLRAEVENRQEQGQPLLRPGKSATLVIQLR